MSASTAFRSTRQQLDALATSLRSLDGARLGLPPIHGLDAGALEPASALAPLAADDFVAVAGTPSAAYQLARTLLDEEGPIQRNVNLSDAGKRAQLLPLLTRFRSRAERLRERVDRGREALAVVRGRRRAPTAPDMVAALRAREIREHLSRLSTADAFEVVRNALDAVAAQGAAAGDARETLIAVLDAPAIIRAHFKLTPEFVAAIESALDPQRASTVEALAWGVENAESALGVLEHWLGARESAAGAPRFRRPTDDPAADVEQARDAVRRAIGPDAMNVA